MKILITGADGMVGSGIKEIFLNHKLKPTDIDTLDVRYWQFFEREFSFSPDLVIHLAAMTDLEKCEIEPDNAYFTNATGAQNAVEFCNALDIPLVYISTAGIFDGTKKGYTELDNPHPVNHYGRSKLYGEQIVSAYRKSWIFRAGWMYGGGKNIDKKFVNKIIKQFDKGEVFALTDIYGSPTYTKDLATVIFNAIKQKIPYGIYNAAGLGVASRYDVAELVIKIVDKRIKLHAVEGDYFSESFYCPRAKHEILVMDKIQNQAVSGIRYWKNSMEEYLKKYYA